MLLSNEIAGFFDPQYLLKESINMLQFLHGFSHQRKVASEATTFSSMWTGVSSHTQNLPRLANAAFR